jgi:hypothetical protein
MLDRVKVFRMQLPSNNAYYCLPTASQEAISPEKKKLRDSTRRDLREKAKEFAKARSEPKPDLRFDSELVRRRHALFGVPTAGRLCLPVLRGTRSLLQQAVLQDWL